MSEQLLPRCPDCNTRPGELHDRGCCIEQCPSCGYKVEVCGHLTDGTDAPSDGERIPWSGLFPGKVECREFGWFESPRALPCGPDEPGAREALNRLFEEARWDPARKRWVK